MGRLLNLSALFAMSSVGVLAKPTAALIGDILPKVSLLHPPVITKVVTTTYPASTPTTYTSSTYDTGCDCYYSTIFWWTPHPYPTSTPTSAPPGSTVTVTVTSTTEVPTTVTVTSTTEVPTTTTVTATATVTAPCTPSLTCDKVSNFQMASET